MRRQILFSFINSPLSILSESFPYFQIGFLSLWRMGRSEKCKFCRNKENRFICLLLESCSSFYVSLCMYVYWCYWISCTPHHNQLDHVWANGSTSINSFHLALTAFTLGFVGESKLSLNKVSPCNNWHTFNHVLEHILNPLLFKKHAKKPHSTL